jgi:hypothetical protein
VYKSGTSGIEIQHEKTFEFDSSIYQRFDEFALLLAVRQLLTLLKQRVRILGGPGQTHRDVVQVGAHVVDEQRALVRRALVRTQEVIVRLPTLFKRSRDEFVVSSEKRIALETRS